MTDVMDRTTHEGVDLTLFDPTPDGTKLRCTVCGMTGYWPQLYFGVRFEWWGDSHATHPWECSSCDRKFTTAGGLSVHRRRWHP